MTSAGPGRPTSRCHVLARQWGQPTGCRVDLRRVAGRMCFGALSVVGLPPPGRRQPVMRLSPLPARAGHVIDGPSTTIPRRLLPRKCSLTRVKRAGRRVDRRHGVRIGAADPVGDHRPRPPGRCRHCQQPTRPEKAGAATLSLLRTNTPSVMAPGPSWTC